MLILPMMRRSIDIGDNSGKIEHQREHLCWAKTSTILYKLWNYSKIISGLLPNVWWRKSGYWISETKEIKIHTGSQMLACHTKNILNEN
jgi:hypothetical protein